MYCNDSAFVSVNVEMSIRMEVSQKILELSFDCSVEPIHPDSLICIHFFIYFPSWMIELSASQNQHDLSIVDEAAAR